MTITPFIFAKMLTKKHFIALFLTFILYFVFGDAVIPAKYCTKNPKTFASCRMNYIWNDTIQDFVSVLDLSLNIDSTHEDPKSITLKVVGNNLFPPCFAIINNKTSGYVAELFDIFQEKIGFKVDLNEMDYQSCLDAVENGSADLMLTAGVVKEGSYNTKLMQPFIKSWFKLYFKSFGWQPTSMYYFITLTPTTWLVIGACVIILCIVLWATLKLLAKLEKRQRNISLASCFIATISGYLNQGFEFRVQNASYRVQIMTSLLLGYVIATAISANLVAKITTSYEYFPIKAIHELENQHKYGLCIRTASLAYNTFSRYEDGKKLLLDKWVNIVNVPECGNVNQDDALATKPCRDNLFLLENVVIMEYLLDHNLFSCEITELPQKLYKSDNSIILNKFAERRLNNTLNIVYLQLLESGVRNRIKNQWLQRKIQEDNKKVLSPVTMEHMRGIFILNVFFMCISLVVLLFEILVFNANNNSKSTKPKKLQKIIISKP